mmetsp:Transcript_6633/g.16882  ORF Transcript_6633/g.16882 Transcript_6633/m.16882 type:complete len:94 (+) Transcript_6633:64-345(+)
MLLVVIRSLDQSVTLNFFVFQDHFQRRGAVMVGSVDCEGYSFKRSRALKQGKLCGLAIDLHNQPDLTEPRVANWVAQLRREFGLSGATDRVGN